jgi:hypothetical protein
MAQTGSQSGAFSVVLPTLAVLLFVASLIALFIGMALAFPGPAWIPVWNFNREAYESFHHLGWVAAVLLLVLAFLAGAASIGLTLQKRWAWWMAILLFLTNGAGDLISLIHTDDTLRFGTGIAIAAGFVFLLMLPSVRRSTH